MIIEGTYTLQATPEAVCQCLMDEQARRRAGFVEGIDCVEVHHPAIGRERNLGNQLPGREQERPFVEVYLDDEVRFHLEPR